LIGIQTTIRKFNIDSKNVKRIIALVVILAVGVTAVIVYRSKSNTKQTTQTVLTSKVNKGNFSISITGTGSVASTNIASVSPKTAGTITKVNFNEGDVVKQGDLLYEMDDSSAKLAVEKIKNNIATAQLSSQDNISDITKLNILAPVSGIVTSIPAKVGDTVAKSGQVATIIDQSMLKVTVPIKVASIGGIREGASALVHVQTIMQSIQGTITLVTSPITTSDGMQMVNLEVTVPNTGTLKEGLKATVEVNTGNGSVFSTDTGSLAYINSSIIKSETGGTIGQINFKEGGAISAGDVIMSLSSSDLQLTKQTNDIKMKDLISQLDTAEKELEEYKVYSTIDGTITSQNLHTGDALKVAEVSTKIANVQLLQCSIPIDELDISKVKVGQKTTITADALAETLKKPLVGAVTSIGISGATTNGVTTYPVIISIPYINGMRPGMNISAEIFVQDKANALTVPIEAIQKVGPKNYLIVKGGTGNGYDELTKLIQEFRQQSAAGNNQRSSSGTNKSSTTSSANKSSTSNNASKSTSANSVASSSANKSSSSTSTSSSSKAATTAKTTVNYTQYYQNTILKEVELGINNASTIEILSGVSEGDEVVLPPKSTAQSSSSQGGAGASGFGGMGMIGGGQPGGQRPGGN